MNDAIRLSEEILNFIVYSCVAIVAVIVVVVCVVSN